MNYVDGGTGEIPPGQPAIDVGATTTIAVLTSALGTLAYDSLPSMIQGSLGDLSSLAQGIPPIELLAIAKRASENIMCHENSQNAVKSYNGWGAQCTFIVSTFNVHNSMTIDPHADQGRHGIRFHACMGYSRRGPLPQAGCLSSDAITQAQMGIVPNQEDEQGPDLYC